MGAQEGGDELGEEDALEAGDEHAETATGAGEGFFGGAHGHGDGDELLGAHGYAVEGGEDGRENAVERFGQFPGAVLRADGDVSGNLEDLFVHQARQAHPEGMEEPAIEGIEGRFFPLQARQEGGNGAVDIGMAPVRFPDFPRFEGRKEEGEGPDFRFIGGRAGRVGRAGRA